MRPTGNRSRDLGCLELPSGPPCPPPPVKQKRNAEGPPLTLVRAVTHSAAASALTSSWLKYPPRPVALPPPPPSCYHHYLLILYADLFHFFSSVTPKLFPKLEIEALLLSKAWKCNYKLWPRLGCWPWCYSGHSGCACTWPPQHDPNLTTTSTHPPISACRW